MGYRFRMAVILCRGTPAFSSSALTNSVSLALDAASGCALSRTVFCSLTEHFCECEQRKAGLHVSQPLTACLLDCASLGAASSSQMSSSCNAAALSRSGTTRASETLVTTPSPQKQQSSAAHRTLQGSSCSSVSGTGTASASATR